MANLNPVPKAPKHARELIQRTRAIMLNALDVLDQRGKPMSELVANAAEQNPIKFLECAAKLVPKELTLEIQATTDASKLSDAELMAIIEQRQQERLDSQAIDSQAVSADAVPTNTA